MPKKCTKIIITINICKDGLDFGRHEVPINTDTEAYLKDTYMPTVYLKLNKSFDIFNTISQAVIKATNGKRAFLPIDQVDEIYVVNRLLLQTVSGISKLRIKESRVFYKPKHLKGVLKDFKLDHIMSNDENKMLQALRCPKPYYGAGFVKTGYETSKCNYSNLNKTGKDEYYVVFCFRPDLIEVVSVNDVEKMNFLLVSMKAISHTQYVLDLSELSNSRTPGIKDMCKTLTTDLIHYVLKDLKTDVVNINKVVRVVFTSDFLNKYRDNVVGTNRYTRPLHFGVDHIFQKHGFAIEPYINFKKCNLNDFLLETESCIKKLKAKGEL